MVKIILTGLILSQIVCVCFAEIQPKVVNGYPSRQHQFPYYVFMRSDAPTNGKYSVCGGTLISDRWVSTAAHCLTRRESIVVFFGFIADDLFYDGQKVMPSQQIIHPSYRVNESGSDIGLIRLPYRVESSMYVRPVKLSDDCGEGLASETVIAIGRGGDTLDPIIRYGVLEVQSNHVCEKLLASRQFDIRSIICGFSPTQHIFSGDSGGPLIRKRDGALVGVTSFIQYNPYLGSDGYKNQAFTNIHYYNKWITAATGINLPRCNSANGLHISTVLLIICSLIVLKFQYLSKS